MKCNFSN